MTKELKEIVERLAEVENRSASLEPLAETAEDTEVEERAKVLDEIENEKRDLLAKKEELEKKEEETRAVENNQVVVEEIKHEERKVKTMTEVRSSKEYLHAFANYIKTGKDDECRTLLTENVSGTVPVPEIVDSVIRTAWDNEPIMNLVRKTNLKGNVKIGFEISGSDAVVHTEGDDAPAEETLSLGIVEMIPQTIKKWIKISDEIVDLDDGAFISYIYDELAHKIAKKAADSLVGLIVAAPTTATATACSVAEVATAGITDIVNAVSMLSDEATNPVVIMNKQSYAYYRGLAMAANYGFDVFDGLEVVFNNTLAVADGTTTGCYAIVGDLGNGAQANYPNGEGMTFKYDDVSLAEADLVKIVGRTPVALAVTSCGMFTRVVKA